jgi:ferrous iron transport protein B
MALLGHPNCGKTALFNLLTGSRQKVANYAGVTVERKEGLLTTPSGRRVRVLDLPGAYSLNALSADEAVTRDVVTGQRAGEAAPDLLVCVVDATNLQLNLRMVLEAQAMGLPMVLALNMSDAARRAGITIDRAVLSASWACPWWKPWASARAGRMSCCSGWMAGVPRARCRPGPGSPQGMEQVLKTQQEVRRILRLAVREPPKACCAWTTPSTAWCCTRCGACCCWRPPCS